MSFWWVARSLIMGVAFSCAFIFAFLPEVFVPSFLLAVVMTGFFLYWRYPAGYPAFVLWLWLITPEVRRLSDWNMGGMSSEFVMLAPYLVAAIAWLTVIRYARGLKRKGSFPFVLASLGVSCGFFTGVINHGIFLALFAFLQWIVPLGLGLHIALRWKDYYFMRDNLDRFFKWGVLILSAYAIVQFVFLPEWDRLWMQNVDMRSIGLPEPFLVRVFSTMNSPGPYAIFMMVGLIYLLGTVTLGRVGSLAIILGYPAFLVTLVRSAWGGWIIGVLFLMQKFFLVRGKRFAVLFSMLGLFIVGGILLLEDGVIVDRIASLSQIGEDPSYLARAQLYAKASSDIISRPLGAGLGSFGGTSHVSDAEVIKRYGAFDSGILEIPYVLGWLGGLFYIWALVWLILQIVQGCFIRNDPYLLTYCAIVMALVSQLVFGPAHRGVSGVFLWSMIGMTMASMKYMSRYGEG